jgi:hypothetical protein
MVESREGLSRGGRGQAREATNPSGDVKMVQPVSGNSYVAQVVAQAQQQAETSSSSNSTASTAIQDTLSLSAAGLKASGADPDGDGDGH